MTLITGCVSSSPAKPSQSSPNSQANTELTRGEARINALEACIMVAELFEYPPTDNFSIQMEILSAQSLLSKASNGSDIYRDMFNSLSDFKTHVESGNFDSAKRASDRFFSGCDTLVE